MYELYYYNQGVYYFQKRVETLKAAKEFFNAEYKGYILNSKTNKIAKRYK